MEISRNLPKKFGKTKYLENWFVNFSCFQSDRYLLLLHNKVRAFWINCSMTLRLFTRSICRSICLVSGSHSRAMRIWEMLRRFPGSFTLCTGCTEPQLKNAMFLYHNIISNALIFINRDFKPLKCEHFALNLTTVYEEKNQSPHNLKLSTACIVRSSSCS